MEYLVAQRQKRMEQQNASRRRKKNYCDCVLLSLLCGIRITFVFDGYVFKRRKKNNNIIITFITRSLSRHTWLTWILERYEAILSHSFYGFRTLPLSPHVEHLIIQTDRHTYIRQWFGAHSIVMFRGVANDVGMRHICGCTWNER